MRHAYLFLCAAPLFIALCGCGGSSNLSSDAGDVQNTANASTSNDLQSKKDKGDAHLSIERAAIQFDQVLCMASPPNRTYIVTRKEDGHEDFLKVRIPSDPDSPYAITSFEFADVGEGGQKLWTAATFESAGESPEEILIRGSAQPTIMILEDDGNYVADPAAGLALPSEFELRARCPSKK
ncbi:MAG: hypothetical protein ACRBEQ_05065 [Hyphomonas sp.]